MSQYPSIAAGQRITSTLLTSMLPTFIHKTSATSRVNNTMADDPDLTITLAASSTYDVQFWLFVAGGTSGDFRTQWTVPSGASGNRSVIGPSSTAADSAADDINARLGVHGFGTSANYSGVRNSAASFFTVVETGRIITTSSGTLALLWGQVATDAVTAAVVGGGSYLRIQQLA